MAGKLIMMSLMFVVLSAAFQTVVHADSDSNHPTPSQVHLTQVTKTEGQTSYTLNVEYEADAMPAIHFISERILMEVSHQRLGFVEIQVPKPAVSGHLIFFGDHFGWIAAQIDFTSSTSMEVPRMRAQVQQGSDITFQPGNDVIQVDLSRRVDGDFRSTFMFTYILVKSEKEDNTVEAYNDLGENSTAPMRIVPISKEGTEGNQSETFQLRPSGGKRDVEGILYLHFGVDFDCSSNCLVRNLMQRLHVRFYREDHAGPFPPGFLGFVHMQGRERRSDEYCGYGRGEVQMCFVHCEVAGDHLQDIQISRLGSTHHDDDGQTHANVLAITGEHDAMAYMPTRSRQGGGDYRCTARSSTREISRTVSVHFVMYPKIDRELSKAERFENGSVRATCVATGKPAPTIRFFQSSAHRPALSPDDYDVTVTHEDELTARAELFVQGTDSAVMFVDCTASNNPNVDDHYILDLGDSVPNAVHQHLPDVVREGEASD